MIQAGSSTLREGTGVASRQSIASPALSLQEQTLMQQQQQQQQQATDALKRLHITAPPRAFKRVRFGFVTIRNYDITMGDNPAVTSGPPVSLSWTFEQIPPLPVREFENFRAAHPRAVDMYCLMITADVRREMLKRAGFSKVQILNNEQRVAKIQKQRARTRMGMPLSMVEQAMKTAGRKLQRSTKQASAPANTVFENAVKLAGQKKNDPADDHTASTASTSSSRSSLEEEALVDKGPWF